MDNEEYQQLLADMDLQIDSLRNIYDDNSSVDNLRVKLSNIKSELFDKEIPQEQSDKDFEIELQKKLDIFNRIYDLISILLQIRTLSHKLSKINIDTHEGKISNIQKQLLNSQSAEDLILSGDESNINICTEHLKKLTALHDTRIAPKILFSPTVEEHLHPGDKLYRNPDPKTLKKLGIFFQQFQGQIGLSNSASDALALKYQQLFQEAFGHALDARVSFAKLIGHAASLSARCLANTKTSHNSLRSIRELDTVSGRSKARQDDSRLVTELEHCYHACRALCSIENFNLDLKKLDQMLAADLKTNNVSLGSFAKSLEELSLGEQDKRRPTN